MKKSLFFYVSLVLAILSAIILIAYPLLVKAPVVNNEAVILFLPPIFGWFGLILSIIDFVKRKDKQTIILIILSIMFIFSWQIIFYGGTLLFGV